MTKTEVLETLQLIKEEIEDETWMEVMDIAIDSVMIRTNAEIEEI